MPEIKVGDICEIHGVETNSAMNKDTTALNGALVRIDAVNQDHYDNVTGATMTLLPGFTDRWTPTSFFLHAENLKHFVPPTDEEIQRAAQSLVNTFEELA